MINKDKTKLKYQYDVDTLSPTSSKMIIWQCDEPLCVSEREFSFAYYLKKKAHSIENNDGKEVCQKCAHKHRSVQKSSIEKVAPKNKAIELPPEVNAQRTMEKFGEVANEIPPWSRKKVVLNCHTCTKECESARCNLNMYESILQTGHFKCKGCFTGERRKGVKVSELTKKKMVEAQHRRRDKEMIEKWGPQRRVVAANGEYETINKTPVNDGVVIPMKRKGD